MHSLYWKRLLHNSALPLVWLDLSSPPPSSKLCGRSGCFWCRSGISSERRNLIVTMTLLSAIRAGDFCSVTGPSGNCCWSTALAGMFSVVAQILIPLAATIAKPQHRGRTVGIIMSGSAARYILLARGPSPVRWRNSAAGGWPTGLRPAAGSAGADPGYLRLPRVWAGVGIRNTASYWPPLWCCLSYPVLRVGRRFRCHCVFCRVRPALDLVAFLLASIRLAGIPRALSNCFSLASAASA